MIKQIMYKNTDDDVKCYNIWERMFTCDEILSELNLAGDWEIELYSNVTGEKYSKDSKVLCSVATKR